MFWRKGASALDFPWPIHAQQVAEAVYCKCGDGGKAGGVDLLQIRLRPRSEVTSERHKVEAREAQRRHKRSEGFGVVYPRIPNPEMRNKYETYTRNVIRRFRKVTPAAGKAGMQVSNSTS
jgi:hypothetical protein